MPPLGLDFTVLDIAGIFIDLPVAGLYDCPDSDWAIYRQDGPWHIIGGRNREECA
jgi:hypothetical protein